MLFDELKIKINRLGDSKEMSDEEIARYEKAKQEFLTLLESGQEGVDLVKEVFMFHDLLTAEYLENHPVACGDGCGNCCHQLVCCTTLEMELISKYLKAMPRLLKMKIIKRAREKAVKFYYQNEKIIRSSARWEEIGEHLRLAHRGLRCIYLNTFNRCTVYPVRPIDCRSAKSVKKCSEVNEQSELKSIKLFFDQIASDLITKEEEKTYGQLQVVPLIAWPMTHGRTFF